MSTVEQARNGIYNEWNIRMFQHKSVTKWWKYIDQYMRGRRREWAIQLYNVYRKNFLHWCLLGGFNKILYSSYWLLCQCCIFYAVIVVDAKKLKVEKKELFLISMQTFAIVGTYANITRFCKLSRRGTNCQRETNTHFYLRRLIWFIWFFTSNDQKLNNFNSQNPLCTKCGNPYFVSVYHDIIYRFRRMMRLQIK